MVSGKSIAVVALAVCAVAVGSVIYTSIDTEVVYPGSMSVEALQDFRVVICYHFDKIYEGTEFKVEVYNADTEKVVEGANVSFMIPEINHLISKEGSVYFYAPGIQEEYLLHPNDTFSFFPLVVNKEGYNTYTTTITVHLAE